MTNVTDREQAQLDKSLPTPWYNTSVEQLEDEKTAADLLAVVVLNARNIYAAHDQPLDQTYLDTSACKNLLADNPELLIMLKEAHLMKKYQKIRNHHLLKKMTTPTNAQFLPDDLPEAPSSPERSPITKQRIVGFLEEIESELREYLLGQRKLPLWTPDDSFDWSRDLHFKDLAIPSIDGSPSLLLHDLGRWSSGKHEISGRIDRMFRKNRNILLCNTSGSGKTRLILEGLSHRWGLYFTCVADQSTIGSKDVTNIISDTLEHTSGFHSPLPFFLGGDSKRFRDARDHNEVVAKRRFEQVLLSRLLIMERFLALAYEIDSTLTQNHQRLWLLLQVTPTAICSRDIFHEFAAVGLRRAPNEVLGMIQTVFSRIMALISESASSEGFFCAIDEEAQFAATRHMGAFVSKDKYEEENSREDGDGETNQSSRTPKKRPVLREVVRVWHEVLPQATFIVSGTGMSIKVVNESLSSGILKEHRSFELFTDTGSFDTRQAQEEYVRRYLPLDSWENDTREEFLSRIWHWLQGRYRFTATYISHLLQYAYHSPHRLLNAYIDACTTFTPTDFPACAAAEPEVHPDVIHNKMTFGRFDFEKLHNKPALKETISGVVFRYIIRRNVPLLTEEERELIELGFARFVHSEIKADEPLVILAAANWLSSSGFDARHYLDGQLRNNETRPVGLEDYIAWNFSRALKEVGTLDKLLIMRDMPDFVKQTAEVVAWTLGSDGMIQVFPTDQPSYQVANTCLGFDATTPEETLHWFQDARCLTFLFPDNNMGPDIVCLLKLADNTLVWVVIQVKAYLWENLKPKVVEGAIKATSPDKFYINKNGEPFSFSSRPQLVPKLKRCLAAIPRSNNIKGKYNLLRVVAAYPARATIKDDLTDPDPDSHALASLDMTVFSRLDSSGIFTALGAEISASRLTKRIQPNLKRKRIQGD